MTPAPKPQNPCEEQGCTDTDNCDEICEHSRIYSPAWVKQHDAAIRNTTLDELTHKLIELVIIDGTTEFVKFKRHAVSSAIDSLRTKEQAP